MIRDRVQWLFVDLNSYFASVEQQINPKLRGRPVAVVPMLADTTSCIAASHEAKLLGIKTGTRVAEAKRLCPEITLIAGDHSKYIEYHEKIVRAVEKCLPITAVQSIDEMACKLMGKEQEIPNATQLGHQVKQSILKNAGDYLRCSVGLAPNRFLAKVASDFQKPDGLTVFRKSELREKLLTLKPRDLPGIGAQMEKRLMLLGVRDMTKLLSLTIEEMRQAWGGINGEYMFQWLRGEQTEDRQTNRRSIGHSHVLAPEMREKEKAFLVTQKLLHKSAARLRKENFWCSRLSLSISFSDRDENFQENISFLECRDDITLLEALRELWRTVPRFATPLKTGVVLEGLVSDENHTLSLFANPRREKLSEALDGINARFGKGTLNFASQQAISGAAPTRIAFTNIPDIETEIL